MQSLPFLTRWLAPAAIAAFVVMVVATFGLVPEPPGTDSDPQIIADYYAKYETRVIANAIVWSAAMLLLVVAAGAVAAAIRRSGSTSPLIEAVTPFAAIAATVMVVSQAALGATSIIAGQGIDPGVVRGMDETSHMVAHFFGLPMAGFVALTSLSLASARLAPKWLAAAGLLIAAFHAIGVFGVFNPEGGLHVIGILGIFTTLPWAVAVAVSLARATASRATARPTVNARTAFAD